MLAIEGAGANNIRVVGVPEVTKAKNDSIAAITFTIAWDNSWKSSKPANWDAAWIYVKCWDGDQWNHAYLSADASMHTAGNKDLPNYRVQNRDGSLEKMPMAIKCGTSMVCKKWKVDPTEDSVVGTVGVFLYRKDSLGAGDIVVPGVSLRWNYKDQGFVYDDDLVVKVFAVEMVYVPEGAYFLGGVGTAAYQVGSFTTNGTTFGTPMNVTSEGVITIANNATSTTLWTSAQTAMGAGSLPAAFPKGYQAFYIMKYELTQEGYADFLNTLNQGQQDGRVQAVLSGVINGGSAWDGTPVGLSAYRNYIEVSQRAPIVQFGIDATNNNKWNETKKVKNNSGDTCLMGIDGQDLAVNFVSFYDLMSYADFAGLRPMTELEYEKACRGDKLPVIDEYAWGSSTLTYANRSHHTSTGAWFNYNTTSIYDINTGNERMPKGYNAGAAHGGVYSNQYNWWGSHIAYYNTHYGAPVRVGCFADSTTTRAAAGASYWGAMNMSDNCSELCISVGNNVAAGITGRLFAGVHGDGQLAATGNADVAGWKMTNVPNYYIPRGMAFPTRSGSSLAWTFESHKNGDYLYGENKEAGRTSSRAMLGHAVDGQTREYATFMSGIRCVRTETTVE